ncbi:extended synaptotagmin-2-A-like isoform X2 [Acipenser ruthenus]|uniref:extended synaptotagmin-2-A-like isoform X2 n=1 Tax=Acipenser ruthenus TaxID=7906 RepID=UPI002741F993|nr:extended synaptotagmin-2-A-like isoform X2 [Acipenser ruthenus]
MSSQATSTGTESYRRESSLSGNNENSTTNRPAGSSSKKNSTADVKDLLEEEPKSGGLDITGVLLQFVKFFVIIFPVYVLGYFGLSFSWVLIGLVVFFWWRRNRGNKNSRLYRALAFLDHEENSVRQSIHSTDLPPWVHFPDVERVEWLNKTVKHMWPYICQFIDKLFHETIEPAVKGAHSHLSTFSFTKIDMGDKPLRINGVKVYTENVDTRQIILDMQISFVGNTEIDVEIKKYFCRAGVKSIQLSGTMRVILEPLIGDMPIIGAVSLFFLRKPLLDINWTGITNILDIPGLNGLSDTVISDIICNYLVLPNRITVPLVGDVQLAQLRFPMPKGVLRIHFLEAQDLVGKDTFLKGMIKGKSDPYGVIQVGRHLFQTKTIKENLNPKWKEIFEALVYENPGQQLEIELFDEDTDKDDFLGSLMIDLAEVQKEQSVDEWFVLDEVATGKLHLKLEWLTLLPTPEKLDQVLASIKADKGQANDGLSSSLLIIYLDSARNLPSVFEGNFGCGYLSERRASGLVFCENTASLHRALFSGKKVSSDPNPFVQLSVGHTTYESKVRYKTNEPVWEEAFTFLIHNPKRQELDIEIKDEKHDCSLGTVNLPLINLMEAEEMTLTQRFPIKSSGPNSTIKLKLALRILSLESQQKSGQPSLVQVKKSPNFTKDGKKVQPTVSGKTDSNLPATASTSSMDINRKPESYENPGASSSSPQRVVDLNKSSSNLNIASYPGSPTHLSAKEATPSIASDISHPYATQELRQRLRHLQNGTAPPHMPLGQVQLTVRHSSQRNRLIVVVHACRNLIAFSEAGSDPYIRMYLLPDKRRSGRRKTAVVKKTLNPVYDETFDFSVSLIEVPRRTLDVAVKNSGGFLSKDKGLLGKALIDLTSEDINKGWTQWYDLTEDGTQQSVQA